MSWCVGMTPDTMDTLIAVAVSVGMDVHNPEGGLRADTPDTEIIEVVTDIAQGPPYNLHLNRDGLSSVEESLIVSGFLRGVADGIEERR